MLLKNFDQLATTSLRKQALLIAEAGMAVLSPRIILRDKISLESGGTVLKVAGSNIDLEPFRRILVIGFGTMATEGVAQLQVILGDRIAGGVVIDTVAGSVPKIVYKIGTYPFMSVANVAATQEVIELLKSAHSEDLIISVISDSASSLLCAPSGMTIEQERAVIAELIKAGAKAAEVTIVQKHISLVKGGQLAKVAQPATMVNLIFSDTNYAAADSVGGGPTVADSSTIHDASEIVQRYNVLNRLNQDFMKFAETSKRNGETVHNIVISSPTDAVQAMKSKARDI